VRGIGKLRMLGGAMAIDAGAEESRSGEGRARAREQALVAEHLSRVRATVNRIAQRIPASIEREELVQAGVLGLIGAARRFDPGQGCSFATYAEIRIRGAVLDQLRSLDWATRGLRRSERALESGRRAVEQREGRAAEAEEVASQLGLSPEGLEALQYRLRGLGSPTDASPLDDAMLSSTRSLWSESDSTNPLHALHAGRERQAIASAVAALPQRERHVVSLLYWNELRPEQVARALELDVSRVRDLHARGLRRLRGRLRDLFS
jgi:RNA polymerase sigma factor for flagellar operon FliA